MDIDNYLAHYRIFDAEFNATATLEDRLNKCREECNELIDAIINYKLAMKSTDKKWQARATEDLKSELADNMNTSMAAIVSSGIPNPLMAGYLKLQATAVKYKILQKNNSFVLEGGAGDESGTSNDPAANQI